LRTKTTEFGFRGGRRGEVKEGENEEEEKKDEERD
jgi:hypothetical protein